MTSTGVGHLGAASALSGSPFEPGPSSEPAGSSDRSGARAATEPEVLELRGLLRAAEHAELLELRQRVVDLEARFAAVEGRTESVSEVLASSFAMSAERDSELADALRPQVSAAIHNTARENPEMIADALYPVIGRAVRMMIVSMMPGGSDAAEVQFPYSVDHLYLIERESGLPIASASSDVSPAQDADVITGMLEAIRSFVQDSFGAGDLDGMRELTVGDVTVVVEWGPQALLAAVLSGLPPQSLRYSLQEHLEYFHQRHQALLLDFDGDDDTATPVRLDLERALRDEEHQALSASQRLATPSAPPGWVVAAIAIGVIDVILLIAVVTMLLVR